MIVLPCPQRAEASLLRGEMRCPHCAGVLRPHEHARTRRARPGLGDAARSPTGLPLHNADFYERVWTPLMGAIKAKASSRSFSIRGTLTSRG